MQKMEEIIYYDEEMECILDFIHQWEAKHPEEEMVFLTLPRHNPEKRKHILQTVIKMLGEEREIIS